jgi:hypothetical protein
LTKFILDIRFGKHIHEIGISSIPNGRLFGWEATANQHGRCS